MTLPGSQGRITGEAFRPQRSSVDFNFHALALAQGHNSGDFFEGFHHQRICYETEVEGWELPWREGPLPIPIFIWKLPLKSVNSSTKVGPGLRVRWTSGQRQPLLVRA